MVFQHNTTISGLINAWNWRWIYCKNVLQSPNRHLSLRPWQFPDVKIIVLLQIICGNTFCRLIGNSNAASNVGTAFRVNCICVSYLFNCWIVTIFVLSLFCAMLIAILLNTRMVHRLRQNSFELKSSPSGARLLSRDDDDFDAGL